MHWGSHDIAKLESSLRADCDRDLNSHGDGVLNCREW
jgi:hypothetical protein